MLSLSSFPEENPKLESLNLTPQIIEQFKKSDTMDWKISCELLFGLSFPKNDEKYWIQIRWADMELNFDKMVYSNIFYVNCFKKTNNGIWEWYAKKSLDCVFPYLSFDEVKSFVSNLIKFFSYRTLLYICAVEMIEYLM